MEETLLLAIETLHKKIISLTESLWATEQNLIKSQNEVREKDEEIAYLKDYIKHQDEEIDDLYNALEASQNLDRLCRIQDENLKLIKKCEDAQNKYNELHNSIMHLYDIDFIM